MTEDIKVLSQRDFLLTAGGRKDAQSAETVGTKLQTRETFRAGMSADQTLTSRLTISAVLSLFIFLHFSQALESNTEIVIFFSVFSILLM